MRTLDAAAQTALEQRAIAIRDFIWFTVKDRNTGDPYSEGYWSDVTTISAEIRNPETGGDEFRTFAGAGNLVDVSPIALTSNLAAQTLTITCSPVANLNELVREYDAKQGRIEVYRGLFTPGTQAQIAPAYPRFFGFIDDMDIKTPPENDAGTLTMNCISHTQELSRHNVATRSSAYMELRSAGDTFRDHCAAVSKWEIRWGVKNIVAKQPAPTPTGSSKPYDAGLDRR